ncbi:hypothetical protein BC629DRAFT_1158917 [Irpex lacteus]|nr:hypothetical protein BC629DRAFT_1158917 [Irpex lacteus]
MSKLTPRLKSPSPSQRTALPSRPPTKCIRHYQSHSLAEFSASPTDLTPTATTEAQRHDDVPYHVSDIYIFAGVEASRKSCILSSILPASYCSGVSSLTTIISAIMPGLTLAPISVSLCDPAPRKRTMPVSSTHSTRSSRSLTRTTSYISLSDAQPDSYTLKVGSTSPHRHDTHSAPYPRPPKPHKERRKSISRSSTEPLTIHLKPRAAKPPAKPSPVPMPGLRVSSPLAPTRSVLPPRPHYPRSKTEPDLYRVALIGRMRLSPEGQKILHMGPRLAMSIYTATQELEKIVASQRDYEGDVNMTGEDGQVLTTSWVVVPQEDWEMVNA